MSIFRRRQSAYSVLWLSLSACLVGFAATAALAIEPGDQAPEFQLPMVDLDTHAISLDDYDGKVRYVDFWASWCGPCRISFPEIESLHAALPEDRFEVIAISVDKNVDDARRFLKRFAVEYPVLLDATGEIAERYQLLGMPTSFVVNSRGEITLVHQGFRKGDMEIIREHIETLLDAGATETGVIK